MSNPEAIKGHTRRIAEMLKTPPQGYAALAVEMVNECLTSLNMTELDFGGFELGDDGAANLAALLKENNTLTKLDLGGNAIDFNGVTAIASAVGLDSCALKHLSLNDSKLTTTGVWQLVAALERNTSLETLELVNTGINDGAAESLLSVFRGSGSLKSIDVSENPLVNPKIADEINCLSWRRRVNAKEVKPGHFVSVVSRTGSPGAWASLR